MLVFAAARRAPRREPNYFLVPRGREVSPPTPAVPGAVTDGDPTTQAISRKRREPELRIVFDLGDSRSHLRLRFRTGEGQRRTRG